jgi:hypothetical protein
MHATLFTILWIRCARTIHIRTAEATGHRKLAAGLDLALFCLRGSVGLAESGGLQIDLDGYGHDTLVFSEMIGRILIT